MGSCVCKDKIEDRQGSSRRVPYRGQPLGYRHSLEGATSPENIGANPHVRHAVLETLHLIRTLIDP
jgi:hypothetical protein